VGTLLKELTAIPTWDSSVLVITVVQKLSRPQTYPTMGKGYGNFMFSSSMKYYRLR